ncbi:Yip1 family protein [Laceyella tengchongensis]|jgi:hypothetical protein
MLLQIYKNMWTQPDDVIHEVVEDTKKGHMVLLLVLFGIAFSLDYASNNSVGDRMDLLSILVMAVVAGPLFGLFVWVCLSGILHLCCRWLGGSASFRETRQTWAWASVVYSSKLPVWLLQVLIFGKEMFTDKTPRIDSNGFLLVLVVLLSIVMIIINIWFVFTLIRSLAEVHHLSRSRVIVAMLLPVGLLFLLMLFLIAS